MPITPAYDIGGFGRLAEIKIRKREEARKARREEQLYRLGELQLQQTEFNLQKMQRQAALQRGLSQTLTNIPEGENQFTTAYSYYMMQGEPELAKKYMDAQSDRIDQIYKMDPEAGIRAYNQTIGKATGNILEYHTEDPIHGDIFKYKDKRTNTVGWASRTKAGEIIPLPEYVEPLPETKEYQLKDKNLQVINQLAGKIKADKATPEEIQTYTLAESDYTQPKRFTDPVTKETFLMQPKLPKGMPTFKPPEEEGVEEQPKGHKEPLISEGGFSINPILDPEKISHKEIVDYRKAADSLYIMRDMLTKLKNDIDVNGLRIADMSEIAKRKSQYTAILMRYKEVLNLGVLNGPDLTTMEKIIKDPATMTTYALGKDWVLPGYENVIESLNRELDMMHSKTGGIVGEKIPEQQESAEKSPEEMTAEEYLKTVGRE